MSITQAILIAILQGVSELFPVSSLGHAVIVPALFHWNISRDDPTFLAFLVVLHLGTAIALLAFYAQEWVAIVTALWKSVVAGKLSDDPRERVGWLVVIGTVPVGLLGILLEATVRNLFASTSAVALFLILNAGLLFTGEALQRRLDARGPRRAIADLSWTDAVKVGLAQSFALLPGISRSGASIVAGLLLDLSHEEAAHYAFLLATPVILSASVLEVPRLFAPEVHLALTESLLGGVVAAVTAYLAVAFLTRYFRDSDLRPFAWYCLGLGSLTFALSVMKVIV